MAPVAGLEKHLELRRLAERQKLEAEEHARKVFWQEPAAPQAPYTVPKPFKLASQALLEVRRPAVCVPWGRRSAVPWVVRVMGQEQRCAVGWACHGAGAALCRGLRKGSHGACEW